MESDKKDLIKYRIERSKETIEDARIALGNSRLHNAENRIYYAMFYIVSALACYSDFSTSSHNKLIGWFNKNYVHAGIVPKEFGKIYRRQFESRMESDYDDYIRLEYEDVKNDYENALRFISEIEKLIFSLIE